MTMSGSAFASASRLVEPQFELMESSIEDIHCGFAEGTLCCRDLVDAYLDRIYAYDKQGPSLNSILVVNKDNAQIRAEQLDAEYSRRGYVGSLHGVPIILKDNFNTKDLPTTGGTVALADLRPGEDAVVVSRLRKAGAIILAKANLHELALAGTTISSLGGQTLNPYDLTRTPGGSSGGTAAAIAANMAVAGTGSDTLNSIRSPASANSLVGIRPTMGLVARTGVIPLSSTQDSIGPIARSVADACRLLDVMAGPDSSDSSTVNAPTPSWYAGSLIPGGLRRARIGVLRTYFGTQTIHEPVNRLMEEAISLMANEGASLFEIYDPALDAEALIAANSVDIFEFQELFDRYLASVPGATIKCLSDLITSGAFHPSSRDFLVAAATSHKGMTDPEYAKRLKKNRDVARHLTLIFDENQLDAVVYPLQKRLVVPLSEPDQVDRNGVLAAVSGFPAITVPIGFSSKTKSAPIGVPVGMDLLGRPWSEGRLIRLAYSYEQASRHRRPPVSTPQL